MSDNKTRRRRKSNKGISLAEVVIIVAIIGILGGYLVYNVNVTNGYRARKAKNLLASQISELKVRTLSKAVKTGDIYMKVYKDGKNNVFTKIYYKEGGTMKQEEPIQIGNRIEVVYGGNTLTTSGIDVEGSTGLILCFNRSTGALMKYTSSGVPSVISPIEFIKTKVFEKEYVIELIPATGKVVNTTG